MMKQLSRFLKSKFNIVIIALLLALIVLPVSISAPQARAVKKSNIAVTSDKNTDSKAANGGIKVSAIHNREVNESVEDSVSGDVQKTDVLSTDPNETEATSPTEPEVQRIARAKARARAKAKAKREAARAKAREEAKKKAESVAAAQLNAGYLVSIDNPDKSYTSYKVSLSKEDRDMAERLVMGEAGTMSFEGACLVAQAIRDTYVTGRYSSIDDLRISNGYDGSIKHRANARVKKAVSFIFDKGGAAVQHRIMYFYATNLCSSRWHETQDYVVTVQNVRFFDRQY